MNIKLETILKALFGNSEGTWDGENSTPETMTAIIKHLEDVAEEELRYFKDDEDDKDDGIIESYEKVLAHLQKARKAIL